MKQENIALWVDRDTHIAIKTAAAQSGLTIKKYLQAVHLPSYTDVQSFEEWLQIEHAKNNPTVLDDDLQDSFDNWIANIDYTELIKLGARFKGFEHDTSMVKEMVDEYCKVYGLPTD